jgi:hypothetical protein
VIPSVFRWDCLTVQASRGVLVFLRSVFRVYLQSLCDLPFVNPEDVLKPFAEHCALSFRNIILAVIKYGLSDIEALSLPQFSEMLSTSLDTAIDPVLCMFTAEPFVINVSPAVREDAALGAVVHVVEVSHQNSSGHSRTR